MACKSEKPCVFIESMFKTKKTTLLLLTLLEEITSDDSIHARFLNTLSYMEYLGSRKMIKSLPSSILDKTFLDHINEETRHSLILKNLAQKLAKKNMGFKEEELIAGESAKNYFKEVDYYSFKFSFDNPILNYLYTTYSVEQRAVAFYSIYNEVLRKKGFSFSLSSILDDELGHLDSVLNEIKTKDFNWENNLDELSQFEHRKYFTLLIDMENSVFSYEDLVSPVYQKSNKDKNFFYLNRF